MVISQYIYEESQSIGSWNSEKGELARESTEH